MQRQLAPAGDRVAVNQRDRGMLRALHALQHVDHVRFGIRGAAARFHLLQVHARAERGARAADDDHAHILPLVEVVEALAKAVEQRAVHRVALPRAIHGDRRDAVGDAREDFVSHG